jgi:DNA-binding SARP family transcriptional activator
MLIPCVDTLHCGAYSESTARPAQLPVLWQMREPTANLARLYLPLLVHPQAEVYRQACAILLATYGERALTYVRRLLDDPDPDVRQQATQALRVIGEQSGLRVELRPFRGIYAECLGTFQVYLDGREVTSQDWAQDNGGRAGGRKLQGVLAYLVHVGRFGATREALGAAVWGGPVSASSLSRTLSALRQLIAHVGTPGLAERVLTVTREHCRLNVELCSTDADLFEQTFNAASRVENSDGLDVATPLYTQVLDLYRGLYMADVPRGSDWSRERRDLLMNDFVIASERLAEYAFTQRQHRHCVALCRRALEADPTAEDVTGWLMRAYARLGLWVEYEQAYQHYLAAQPADAFDDETVCAVTRLYRDLQPRRKR